VLEVVGRWPPAVNLPAAIGAVGMHERKGLAEIAMHGAVGQTVFGHDTWKRAGDQHTLACASSEAEVVIHHRVATILALLLAPAEPKRPVAFGFGTRLGASRWGAYGAGEVRRCELLLGSGALVMRSASARANPCG
jgi:hypothetical protein